MFYTPEERENKHYTIAQAKQSAQKQVTTEAIKREPHVSSSVRTKIALCLDAVAGRADDEAIALPELNTLTDKMVANSLKNHK